MIEIKKSTDHILETMWVIEVEADLVFIEDVHFILTKAKLCSKIKIL
jgi:hypothetical protein